MAGNDYGSQLRSAMEDARGAVLQQHQQSGTLRSQSAVTLSHAEQVLSVGNSKLNGAMSFLSKAGTLFKLSSQGGVIVKNAMDLAASASSDAADAATAMSTAASSIKALSDALDVLASQVAGVFAIAHDDDASTPVDRRASIAASLTASVANLTEQLKNASLDASIEVARSGAEPASSATQVVASDLETVAEDAATLITAATQKMELRRKADVQALDAEKAALEKYQAARKDDESLAAVLEDINAVVNSDLRVVPRTNIDYKSDQTTNPRSDEFPALEVSCLPPPAAQSSPISGHKAQLEQATEGYILFAVPFDESPVFGFDSVLKLLTDAEDLPDPKQPRFFSSSATPSQDKDKPALQGRVVTRLNYDTTGQPLKMGGVYTVFMLRQPKRGLHTARASDLSLPSAPIKLTYSILERPDGKVEQPTVNLEPQAPDTRDDAGRRVFFKVTLTTTEHIKKTAARCRFLLMREDVFRAVQDDMLPLANLLNPAFYKEWRPELGASDVTHTETFTDADTDAFGDTIIPSDCYRALVLLVGGTGSATNSTPANTGNELIGTPGSGGAPVARCHGAPPPPQPKASAPATSSQPSPSAQG
jgi:hypothetical protein